MCVIDIYLMRIVIKYSSKEIATLPKLIFYKQLHNFKPIILSEFRSITTNGNSKHNCESLTEFNWVFDVICLALRVYVNA